MATDLPLPSLSENLFTSDGFPHEWFHGYVSRDTATNLLMAAGGAALVVAPAARVPPAAPLLERAASGSGHPASLQAAPPARVAPAMMPADIMISYRVPESGAGGDGFVFKLKRELELLGFSVFVGEADIAPGASWPSVIQAAVDGCRAFVVLCR
jgi:hypothetical protein